MLIAFALMALLMILMARKEYPDIMFVNKKALMGFVFIMFSVTIFRIIFFNLGVKTDLNINLFYLPNLFLVFWEDMFFTFPALLLYRLTNKPLLVFPLMVLSSVVFAVGHIYQSVDWAITLLAYVPITFFIARKYGLLTVMICHVIYDIVTYLTLYFISKGYF